MKYTHAVFTIITMTAANAAVAKPAVPVLSPIDFFACANHVESVGGPVGVSAGNAQTKFSALTFTLLDPQTGNESWLGEQALPWTSRSRYRRLTQSIC